jgi:hypothetical protein
MNNSVKVTANKEGKVFTVNTNADGSVRLGKDGKQYGFIRVESTTVDFSGALARVKTQSALKTMSLDDFNKAKDFLTPGRELPGKIVVRESLEQRPGYQAKMAGSGENAQACTLGGAQIYRATEFTSDLNATDELIKHDNVIVGSMIASASESLNG